MASYTVNEHRAEEGCRLPLLKIGTLIIAIIQIIFAVLNVCNSILILYRTVFVTTNDHKDDGARFVNIAFAIINIAITAIWLLFIILLLVALCTNKASLMLPHLITTVLMFALIASNGVMMIVKGTDLISGIILIVVVLFMLFLLVIEWRCYKYIRAVG